MLTYGLAPTVMKGLSRRLAKSMIGISLPVMGIWLAMGGAVDQKPELWEMGQLLEISWQ